MNEVARQSTFNIEGKQDDGNMETFINNLSKLIMSKILEKKGKAS